MALDSTTLRANGGVGHQKDRERGVIPHTAIDPETHWTQSGWHGWGYGWKLHVASCGADIWIPLAAERTAGNVADNEAALWLLTELPLGTRFVLGDVHYNAPNVRSACERNDRILIASPHGAYPHPDDGVAVRRIFHKLRSLGMENFNEHFKGIFDGSGQVSTKGLVNTQRFDLGAIFVYQLALLYRFENGLSPCVGLKAFLKAA